MIFYTCNYLSQAGFRKMVSNVSRIYAELAVRQRTDMHLNQQRRVLHKIKALQQRKAETRLRSR